ncbi:MAG: DUF11 domain-containing protein [Acidobacteria bacterium]|nr:DUF11 domain-containing protein [Acidobacteriota bacterium]MBI3421484.1 DUF11 domain-containing protein [Acidobacteriota bacterium]
MRITHTQHLTTRRAFLISGAVLILAGLVFAFAPMRPVAAARQALVARVQASAAAEKILSVAPAPLRTAIKKQLLPSTYKNAAAPVATAAMFTPYNITKSATPPSGSSVGQGQIITYTITITNGATADTTAGNGFIRSFDTSTTQGLFQFNPAFPTGVMTQPGGGSAWGPCTITPNGNGTNQFTCYAGDGIGGGADTFAANQTVVLKVDMLVSPAATPNNIINDTAFFETDLDGNGVDEVFIGSNIVSHIVAPSADLAITKFAQTAQPPLPDPQNSVLAGGNSVGMISLGSIGNEGRGNISYVLTVNNLGPANATNVIIEDQVPGGPVQLAGVNAPPQDYPVAGPVPGQPIIPAALGVIAVSIANDTGGPPVGTATTFAIGCHDFGAGALLTCRPGNNIAINPGYTPGVLPAGFQARIAYRLRVLASATLNQIIGNSARITSNGSEDINAGNNTSLTTSNVVITKADLGITKVTSNPTPTAGGAAFSYTLVVTNNGPSDAQNIVVTDPLPPGIVFQNVGVVNNPAIAGYGLICTGPPNATNGTVTCTGSLPGPDPNTAAVSTSTIFIVAQIVPNVASGVRTNTATVASATQEPTPNVAPNTASVQQNIVVDAPLSITKAGPATICAGDTYTYHITVNNGGSSTALNATISDPLPANTTFLNLSGNGGFLTGCSHNGGTPGTVTCAAVDIPTGQSTLDITVKLSPTAPSGALANTATITTAGTGTIAVGTSTSTATVNHCSDLQITKDDSPDAVLAGQDINYTITVKNVGPSDIGAGEFVVADAPFPPTGTTLKTGTVITAAGFSCNLATAFPCTATSALSAGASATIKFTVTVNANFNGGQPGGFINNTATVNIVAGSNAIDPVSANNTSTVNTPVGPSADLSVQKASYTLAGSAFDAQVTAGGAISAAPPALPVPIVTGQGEIFYGLTYRNSGLGDAVNVHIRDVIPANVQFVAGSIVVTPAAGPALTCTVSPLPTQLDCTPTGGGTLPAGANGTISFRTRVLANVAEGTAIKNTATIHSEGVGATPATPDPNGGNNLSNETQNRVRTEANLAITKTGPASVNAGANITYTLTVTNNGVSDAQNVVVKDTLPPNVSFVSASSTNNQFTCTPDNGNAGVVNCTAATLIANDPNIIPPRSGSNTATITLVGKVAASVANGTVLANNATVSATTSDPVLANNAVGPVNTTVTTDSAVTVIKTDNPDPVVAGTNLTYTITVNNNGPSDAQAVSVVDTLPPATQVQFLSATGTGVFSAANSCAQAANVVTCTAIPGGVFPAGATANITIVVKVLPSVPPNALPQNPDDPAGLLNTVVINWSDSNGVVGPLVAQTATSTQRTTVRHESDMSIKKEAPDFGIAGTRIDYRLTLRNLGPSDVLGDNPPQGNPPTGAGSIIVRDVLPVGTTLANIANNPFVPANGPGGFTCTYTAATREVLCKNAPGAAGNFFAGASLDIIVKVDIDSNVPDGTNLVNCATVTLRNTNPTPEIDPLGGGQHNDADVVTVAANGNNQSCDTTLVRGSADLGIAKTSSPVVDPDGAGPLVPVALPPANSPTGSVAAGGYIRYDVPFGNAGPSSAVNVRITDNVPGNTAFVGALATGGVFVPAAQPPALPFTFTIQADTTPAAPINLTCTVAGNPGTAQITCVPADNTGVNPAFLAGVLPASYTGTLTFFVKVNESVSGGTIVGNAANITSAPQGSTPGTSDPNPGNNTSLTTSNLVVANSQLAITKVVQNGTFAQALPATTTVFGLTNANQLVRFNAATPGTLIGAPLAIVGLQAGESVRGIDVRPATGVLYGLGVTGGTTGRLYTIDTVTGAATQIGASFTLPQSAGVAAGTDYGFDFNPTVDRIRVTANSRDNFRLNPITGAVAGVDTALTAGAQVTGAAYDRNNAGATQTTLYGIDFNTDQLVTIGGINGVPSPNTGAVTTVGNLGVNTSADVGFDVTSGGGATAYASLNVAGASGLYTINLASGAATLVGNVPGVTLVDIAAGQTGLVPGTLATYRINVVNNGPSDVSNVRVLDLIPANAKYVAINQIAPFSATFTCAAPTGIVDPAGNGGQVQCTAPLLSANAPNNTAAFDITVFIDPATKVDVTNTAIINATINNFNTSTSATAVQTNAVGPTSDIVTVKSHTNTSADGLSVVAGTIFEYTIDVTNNGPSTAAMPRLNDIIPAFQTIVAKAGVVPQVADITLPTGWTCAPANLIGFGNGATLVCDGPALPPNKKQNGDPNPAGTIQFKFKVRQDPNTPQPAPTFYDNCVTFESMSFDPTTAGDGPTVQAGLPDTTADANGRFVNSSVCDRVNITFVSPLTAAKVDTPDPVIAGNLLTYTITASPQGPSAALNFTISDLLPQGTAFVSAVASSGATLTTPTVFPAVGSVGTGVAGGPTVTAVWDAAGGTAGGLTPVGTVRTLTIVVRVCADFQQIRNLTDAQMCVQNLTNNANIFSLTPPNLVGNPVVASATTTVQAQSDLSIAKSGPASAIPDSVVTYTLTVNNAGPSNANGVVVTDVLPKGFTLVNNSVTITAGAGGGGIAAPNATTATDAAGTQTVTINLGVVGAANQCAAPRATQVIITLQARVPKKHPNIIVTNTATVTSTNCLPETGTLAVQANPLSGFASIITPGTLLLANNRAFFDTIIGPPPNDPGPGSVPGYPATAEISDQKAGSILMYPIYTSDAANPNSQNTRISVTNISSVEQATVHLFVVDGASCSVLDAFICLTPNQTATFLASDFDPGATGYIVAVAVDHNTGLPVAFNCLIGDEFVKFATGHQANLGAEAVAAVMVFPAGTDPSVTTVNLNFNGMNYNRLPALLVSDNIPSRADQNNTLLIVDAIGGNYTRSGATLVSLFGFVYDDAEVGLSYTQNVSTCQFRSQLSNSFPRLFNGFTNFIPAGRSGWMKLSSTSTTVGIIGAQINQNSNANSSSGAFNQGHNLHKLTLNSSVTLTVPIIPPACQ